jgi:hypothetical protein
MNDLEHVEIKPEMMRVGARVVSRRAADVPALSTGDGSITLSGETQAMIDVLTARHVLDPEILTEHAPFFWGAEISSTRLDTYDTRMDAATTLANYAEDLIAGVAFCDSHNHDELPFGRSFAGLLVPGAVDEGQAIVTPTRVFGAFYTLAGMKTNRVSTDDLISSMRGGLVKDVSVGFKAGPGFMYRCSICGLDLFDWDCPHIPGVVYEIPDEAGNMVERYAVAWIVNARLSEVSGVYDGSTPYAMILKATRESKAGRIPERVAKLVENRARVHLPDKTIQIPARKQGDETMTDQEKLAAEKAARDARNAEFALYVRKVCTDSGLANLGESLTAEQLVDSLRAEVVRLRPLADDATKLRGSLIDACVTEGKRALGDKYKEETQRAMLAKLPVEDIETMRDAFKDQADALIPTGRKSGEGADENEDGDQTTTRSALPESAFASA